MDDTLLYWPVHHYPMYREPPPPFTPPEVETNLLPPVCRVLATASTWALSFYTSGFL